MNKFMVVPNNNNDLVAMVVDRNELTKTGEPMVHAVSYIISFTVKTDPVTLESVLCLDDTLSANYDQLVIYDERRDRWYLPADMVNGKGMHELAEYISQ